MLNFFTNGWRRSVRLDDAHLFPQTRESWPGRVLGGVRHPDLPDEFHQWGASTGRSERTDLAYLNAQPAPTARLDGKGLYAGPFFSHFGHFIADASHRLWAWQAGDGAYDYVAILPDMQKSPRAAASPSKLHGFQRQILTYMGVPLDRVILIQEPVVATDLTVPLQASLYGGRSRRPQSYIDFLTDNETRFFGAYADSLPPAAEKIYVSRSKFLSQGGFAGERYLEQQLEAEGFLIVRPEELPFAVQLHYYRQARLLIFAEGSALHSTELMGAMKGDIVCLLRNANSTPMWRSVLHGRNHQIVDMVTPLPPLSAQPDGSPAIRQAISLIDSPALVRYLRQAGYARLTTFDPDQFLQMEAADIARYMINVRMKHTFSQGVTADFMTAFRDALRTAGNPYLRQHVDQGPAP